MEASGQQSSAHASCPSCGADVPAFAGASCPVCGAPAPEVPAAPEPAPAQAHGDQAAPPPPGQQATPPPGPQPGVGALPPPVPQSAAEQARDVVVWTHLSALVGLLGIPSPLGPLVVWLVKRDSHPFVDAQGKEALNFNLSALIYILSLFVFGFIFSFVTLGFGIFLFVPAAIAAMVGWVVLVVVAAVKASRGEAYRYPLTIRFVT